MEPEPPKYLAAALKHYEAVRRAQKAYYDRKHPMETRNPRGRPRKIPKLEGMQDVTGAKPGV